MNFDPLGIHIGPLFIRYYGLLLMFGAVMAAFVAHWLYKAKGKDPQLIWDSLVWVLGFGIAGARLYHIFTPTQSMLAQGFDTKWYLTHPLNILTTWQGGLGMPGALVGGVLGLFIFAKRRGAHLGSLLDVAAPGIALAQAIGRWGNFVNQELYGPPTDLPWAIRIEPQYRLEGYESYERFHPLFLYESIWNLANFVFLVWVYRRYKSWLKEGDGFLIYLITYPIGRFLLEFIRLDYVPIWGLNFNQFLMLLTALASGFVLFYRHRSTAARSEITNQTGNT